MKTNALNIGVLCFAGLALLACNKTSQKRVLYNIDSLMVEQSGWLSSHKASLSKTAIMSGVKEDTIFTPADTTGWLGELEIFQQLHDINKPVNASNYLVDDGLYDVSSNLTVKAFSTIEDLPVKYIRVFYQESIDKPRKIEASVEKASAFFKTSRLMTLHFTQIENKSVLTAYSIEGGQKMMLGDTVAFTIKGKITID